LKECECAVFHALATLVHAPRGGEALLDAQIAIEIAARTSTRVRSNLRTIARAALFHPFFGSKLE
jgi:hypothetical protein